MRSSTDHASAQERADRTRWAYFLAVAAFVGIWLAAALSWASLYLPSSNEFRHLQITLVGEPGIRHQVFYAGSTTFSERDSHFAKASASGVASVRLRLSAPVSQFVRIDAGSARPVQVCKLGINVGSNPTTTLDERNIIHTKQISHVRQQDGCMLITPENGAKDPYIVLAAPQIGPVSHKGRRGSLALFGGIIAIGLALLLLIRIQGLSPVSRLLEHLATRIDNRLPVIYIAMAICLGVGYLLVTPPGAVPDELAHATKAIKVSSGFLMGSTGEQEFPNVYHMYGEFNGFRNPTTRFTFSQLLERTGQPALCEPTTSNLPTGADSYGPHLYTSAAIAYISVCEADASFGAFIWLSRLGNLVIAVLLTAAGIWCSRRARWPLFVISLMPMTLYQMASLSADAIYFGLCFAWLGLMCGIAENRVSARQAAPALVALVIALTFSKPGGAWLLSSILLLRAAFIRDYARFWPALVVYLFLPAIAHAAWVLGAGDGAVPLTGVDPTFNMWQVVENPSRVAQLFINAYTGANGLGLMRSMMGQLGWLDIALPNWAYVMILASLLGSLLLDRSGYSTGLGTKSMVICFAVGSVIMLSIPLYIFWTPADASRVGGLQGRYFIPSLAFALTWLAMPRGKVLQAILMITIPIAMTLPLLHGLLAVASRYYPI